MSPRSPRAPSLFQQLAKRGVYAASASSAAAPARPIAARPGPSWAAQMDRQARARTTWLRANLSALGRVAVRRRAFGGRPGQGLVLPRAHGGRLGPQARPPGRLLAARTHRRDQQP